MKFVKLGDLPKPRGTKAIDLSGEYAKVLQQKEKTAKVAVAKKQGGTTIIHIVEVTLDMVSEFLKEGDSIIQQFLDLFRTLPDGIMIDGKLYRYTQQNNTRSKDNALEAVIMYQHDIDGTNHEAIITRRAPKLGEAKSKAKEALEAHGYM